MSTEMNNPDPSQTAVFGALVSPEDHIEKIALSAAEQSAVNALPEGSALLIVQRGPNAGARFLLNSAQTTAGRHPSSDIFLDDVTVSRRHAMFYQVDGGFGVKDTGSLNGTYVNQERVDDVVLHPGDEVQIGKYRLTYHPHVASAQPQES